MKCPFPSSRGQSKQLGYEPILLLNIFPCQLPESVPFLSYASSHTHVLSARPLLIICIVSYPRIVCQALGKKRTLDLA